MNPRANDHLAREETQARLDEVTDVDVIGARVTFPDLDLVIDLDGGSRLEVRCREDDDLEGDRDEAVDPDEIGGTEEVACWELYMPGDRLLAVWPGGRWRVERYRD